jgi:hypothetical protein
MLLDSKKSQPALKVSFPWHVNARNDARSTATRGSGTVTST